MKFYSKTITMALCIIAFAFLASAPVFKINEEKVNQYFGDSIKEVMEENNLEYEDAYTSFKQQLYIQMGLIMNLEDYSEKYGLSTSYWEEYVVSNTEGFDRGINIFRFLRIYKSPNSWNRSVWNSFDSSSSFWNKIGSFFSLWWNPIPAYFLIFCVLVTILGLLITFYMSWENRTIRGKSLPFILVAITYGALVIFMLFPKMFNLTWYDMEKHHAMYTLLVYFKSNDIKSGLIIPIILVAITLIVNTINSFVNLEKEKKVKKAMRAIYLGAMVFVVGLTVVALI